ncbi:MAG: hypothetical protein AAF480_05140 [Actinomycetota bacterium]
MWPQPGPAPSSPSHRLHTHHARVRLALALARDFPHAHVAALLDPDSTVTDGVILHEAAHTVDHAVGFALCLARLHPEDHVTGTVLFSVVGDAEPLRDADLATWRRIRDVGELLPGLRDWLITDGRVVWSMADTTGTERW